MSEQNPQKKPNSLTPKELVTGSIRLVSLPEVCIRVNEMLDEPTVTAAELGQIIRGYQLNCTLIKNSE